MIRPFFIAVFTVLLFAISTGLCCGALAADHEIVNGIVPRSRKTEMSSPIRKSTSWSSRVATTFGRLQFLG